MGDASAVGAADDGITFLLLENSPSTGKYRYWYTLPHANRYRLAQAMLALTFIIILILSCSLESVSSFPGDAPFVSCAISQWQNKF